MSRDSGDSQPSGPERTARWKIASTVTAVAAVLDILVLLKVVPWANGIPVQSPMSLGYIVTFFLLFCNFMLAVAIITYIVRGESEHSYPSDKWL